MHTDNKYIQLKKDLSDSFMRLYNTYKLEGLAIAHFVLVFTSFFDNITFQYWNYYYKFNYSYSIVKFVCFVYVLNEYNTPITTNLIADLMKYKGSTRIDTAKELIFKAKNEGLINNNNDNSRTTNVYLLPKGLELINSILLRMKENQINFTELTGIDPLFNSPYNKKI